MPPLVTIVITTFNRIGLLHHALQSAVDQTYDRIEIVVVDDGASDAVRDFVNGFPKNLKEIKYIRNTRDKGVSHSRNHGVNVSGGDYIAFLDDDDQLLPHWAEEMVRRATRDFKSLVQVVQCQGGWVAKKDGCMQEVSISNLVAKPSRPPHSSESFAAYVLGAGTAQLTTYMFHRSVFLYAEFDESIQNFEDSLFLAKVFSRAPNYSFVESVLYLHRMSHGLNQLSASLNIDLKSISRAIDRVSTDLSPEDVRLFRFYFVTRVSFRQRTDRWSTGLLGGIDAVVRGTVTPKVGLSVIVKGIIPPWSTSIAKNVITWFRKIR